MNVIFLDHDLFNDRQIVEEILAGDADTRLTLIQDHVSLPEDTPIRGILLTKLNSGLLAYHLELIERYPQICHWIFCVTSKLGTTVQQTLRNHFAKEMSIRDAYCELLFDETQHFEKLTTALQRSTKESKKCAVISQNYELASDVGELIGFYLPDWDIVTGAEPDYLYCDLVLVVGNTISEMSLPCPPGETIKKIFWLQATHPKTETWKRQQIVELKATMNNLGWNMADYASRTSFSNLLHERLLVQLQREEFLPIALISDREFVIWDDYNLPVPQTNWTDELIVDFLERNTVYPEMIAKTQKREE